MLLNSRNVLLVLFAALMVGCASRPTALDAQSRDAVGRVFVSVSSAARLAITCARLNRSLNSVRLTR